MSENVQGLSIVIPAFNEASAIAKTLSDLLFETKQLQKVDIEIIVVDDGSEDGTASIAEANRVRVIRHPSNQGYGRSLLSGIDNARHDRIAIVDADGTYPINRLRDLLAFYDRGFDMVVAARQGRFYGGSFGKRILRVIFRFLAEFTCGRSIPDINSGFRIFDRRPVLQWRESLSTGFSFTTTITLLFMLNNLFVGYLPMDYHQRVGHSKVRLLRDSLRSLQIIFTTIAQFNPLKLYLLLAAINAMGNVMLLLYATQWRDPILFFAAWTWNAPCIIGGCAILAMSGLKPYRRDESSRGHT